jgi:hypothetical protein
VIIRLSGEVAKRKKKLSKKYYGTSHVLSEDEAKFVFEKGCEQLAQLARLEVGFGDFTRIGVSRINRLVVAEGRFGRVVTTLGIFFRGGSSCDGACICATRFAGKTARFTVIGAWFAAFV